MNAFARITAALGVAALFATAVFAQTPAAPTMGKTHVKGYTKTLKNGTMVKVKGYNRMATPKMPKMTHVKGYTKTLKNGTMVKVKGYSRKPSMKPMAPKPGGTM